MPSHRFWKRKRVLTVDELGGTADGALLIVGDDGAHLHVTSPSVAKSLRFLLARLQTSDAHGLPGRVALTSALRGEGVSYITRSLATVISYDTDASVCVVDLNWKSAPPANAKAKGKAVPTKVDERPTLADAVEQGLDVTEIVHPTANPRLSFVAPGIVARARRPAMASSRALEDVIDKLAEQFDHLLLDLPSVLASSDALTLTQLADAFLLVVEQGVTSSSQVQGALDELEARKPLGVVLNRFESNVPPRLRKLVGG
jgi:Mrp family chromosome partitioning ATPase